MTWQVFHSPIIHQRTIHTLSVRQFLKSHRTSVKNPLIKCTGSWGYVWRKLQVSFALFRYGGTHRRLPGGPYCGDGTFIKLFIHDL